MKKIILIILIAHVVFSRNEDAIFSAMKDEMIRSMDNLFIEDLNKPYFIEYKINFSNNYVVESTLGALKRDDESRTAGLSSNVKVGDYMFDNTNFFDIGLSFFGSSDDEERFSRRPISQNPDYNYLRRELWLATDASYKQSAELYSKKIAALKNKNRKDTTPDFIKVDPANLNHQKQIPSLVANKLKNISIEVSKVFSDYPNINSSAVLIEFVSDDTYYYNSEKVKYIKTNYYTGFEIVATTQSNDGMPLANYYTTYAKNPDDLPSLDSLISAAKNVAEILSKTAKSIPVNDDYSGPVMFTGRAAAELFAQNFAGNLVVQRAPVSESGFSAGGNYKAFQTKIGGRVLPEFLSLELNPNLYSFKNNDLVGSLNIDDNGSEAQKATLIKDGYLETLISERIPTKRINVNLGHKRDGAAMYSVLELNSNDRELDYQQMKKRMIELCKKRELPYGIIIKNIINQNIFSTGVFRQAPGLFRFPQGNGTFIPCEIYKVHTDGREELCRGLSGKGFTARAFKDIINVGKNKFHYNFLASAVISPFVSGGGQYIPSSLIMKNLLFEDGELSIPTQDFEKIPILNNPLSKN